MNRSVRAAIAGALALALVALLITLAQSKQRLAGSNGRSASVTAIVPAGGLLCQRGETIPSGAGKLIIHAQAPSPAGALLVSVLSASGTELGRGLSPRGFVAKTALTVPLSRTLGELTDARVCVKNSGPVGVGLLGERTAPAAGAQPPASVAGFRQKQPTLVAFTWYRKGVESWVRFSGALASRFGLMKAGFLGDWTMWVVLGGIGALWIASIALLRHFGQEMPGTAVWWRPALACALIAFGNAAAWSLITPSFQGPDELVHAGYVQYVAETGRVPRPITPYFQPAPDLEVATHIPFSLEGKPSWLRRDDRALRAAARWPLPRVSETGVAYAASNPPLYYALDAIPYKLASAGSFLNRLFFMRLLSSLLAGATVAFVFMFMRELMPRTPWAWTTGALAVAFQPLFGFIGGVVSNDDLLWPASAALFWLVARTFRRGLTPRSGAAIGAALAVGLLSKGSMLGLIPGSGLGLALAAWRSGATRRLAAFASVATAALVFLLLEGGWLFADQHLFGRAASTTATNLNTSSWYSGALLGEQLSYLWQFYLPRLPWMHRLFDHYPTYPAWESYFQGFVGRFGWFQFNFPIWVSWLALAIWVPLLVMAVRGLAAARRTVARRWPELATYAALAAGLILLVGVAGYRYRKGSGMSFEQPRYLFPLIALYGALVVSVARGFGRRLAPAAAAFMVVLAMTHGLFAQLLTIARYYG